MKIVSCDRVEAVAFLSMMAGNEKWDWSGGAVAVEDMLCAGDAFKVIGNEGETLAVFVVQQLEHSRGRDLVIRLARAEQGGRNLTETVLPVIEREFGKECDAVIIFTKRKGLIKKLEASGYEDAARVMRKRLKHA